MEGHAGRIITQYTDRLEIIRRSSRLSVTERIGIKPYHPQTLTIDYLQRQQLQLLARRLSSH